VLAAEAVERDPRDARHGRAGLVVNLSDVTFASGQATLQPGAREKLARVSGILAAHPALRLEIEGHTDSVGSDALNQTLSQKRADAVLAYLIQQGVPAAARAQPALARTVRWRRTRRPRVGS
jgi:outer membrane protein OmpA-like peptidoglycan-associated protein